MILACMTVTHNEDIELSVSLFLDFTESICTVQQMNVSIG